MPSRLHLLLKEICDLLEDLTWSEIRDKLLAPRLGFAFLPLIFIPVAVHILKSIPQQIPLSFSSTVIVIHTGLPFSWKCLYIAALLFTVSSVLYQLRCPRLVQYYSDYDSYLRTGLGLDWLEKQFRLLVLEMRNDSGGGKYIKVFKEHLKPHVKGADAARALNEAIGFLERGELVPDTHRVTFTRIFISSSSSERDLFAAFRALRNLADQSRPRSKGLFLLMILGAWAASSYPLAQSILFVIRYMVKY